MRLDPTFVKQQVEMLKLSHPEIWEDNDEQLILDSLEGETDFHKVMVKIEEFRQSSESMATAIQITIDKWKKRKERIEGRENACRKIMFNLMQVSNIKTLEMPIATLSIRAGIPRIIITDETAIPDCYCRFIRSPDKTEIKKALATGPVEGAVMSNAESVLSIRTK